MNPSLKILLLALQDLKACHLESIACSKQRESLVLQKPTDSISCIEIIEENIPDDNDKSQSEQFKKTRANFQASPLSGLYVHGTLNMLK